jgi:hypothetical protein
MHNIQKVAFGWNARTKCYPKCGLFLIRYCYMQQFVDGPTATPTQSYVHYIDAVGSLMTYMHAQYCRSSIWAKYMVGEKFIEMG